MIMTIVLTLVFIFAFLRLGALGLVTYNLIRLLVGSLAYVAMTAVIVYLFFFKWIEKHEGTLSGFLSLFAGLLLIYQAYFVSLLKLDGSSFGPTFSRILGDLVHLRVSSFAGGGLLGAILYTPIAFLLSNIGTYFIGGLLIVLGLLLMSSYSVYDLYEQAVAAFHSFMEKREIRRQERFVEREEKKALQAEAEEAARIEQLAEASPMSIESYPVDLETGEVMEPVIETEAPAEEAYPQIYLPNEEEGYSEEWSEDYPEEMEEVAEEEDMDEEVTVDFTPKELLQYKLPTIDLFAPDKPKNQSKDVRIEAPIPGKSLVGIEVPNSEIATVSFRELWEQSKTDPTKLLEIPLGKAVDGSARTFDLARMPHLLVAGSTGSGKSVAVNGIISSILMKARPDEVKFMMVDPKMVELSVYNDIPHLLIPVVTNPRKASRALQKVVDEMENRYELFSKVGARNIAGFNAKVAEYNVQSEMKQVPLPLIVVIVDELADLMMVASKEVEDAIIRLGQKARAAGIHMILATQRPSVDVISGLIKANVPSRVAFAVSSGTDSRTILDENGAEKLLGRGDMLFKPIDENHPIRLQGSFISDDDVERIVNFVKEQAEADYDDAFDPGEVSESDFDGGMGGSDEGDPLFEEAKALVIETQKASASMIQRRLSVGFNRATRLMEDLEAAGVIGPAEGTKPRKVLQTN